MEVQTHGDQCFGEGYSGVNTHVEVKVSTDEGETWTWRMINMVGELDESGLKEGEVVQLHGKRYKVLAGDNGLRIKPVKKKFGKRK